MQGRHCHSRLELLNFPAPGNEESLTLTQGREGSAKGSSIKPPAGSGHQELQRGEKSGGKRAGGKYLGWERKLNFNLEKNISGEHRSSTLPFYGTVFPFISYSRICFKTLSRPSQDWQLWIPIKSKSKTKKTSSCWFGCHQPLQLKDSPVKLTQKALTYFKSRLVQDLPLYQKPQKHPGKYQGGKAAGKAPWASQYLGPCCGARTIPQAGIALT